jgi:hypothetical protein
MLRQMWSLWDDINGARRERIKKELAVDQAWQAEVTAYWNRHKATVMDRWDSHSAAPEGGSHGRIRWGGAPISFVKGRVG